MAGGAPSLPGDSSEMIAGDRADGAADIDDLRRSKIGGKRGDDAAAGHGIATLPRFISGWPQRETGPLALR